MLNTVLVTGAGGFVGSAVVRRLARPGTELWDGALVQRVVAAVRPGGSSARLELLTPAESVMIERVDVYDPGALASVVQREQPRAVINTALDARVFSGDTVGHAPLETLFSELAGTKARVVHAGSAWVLAPGLALAEDAVVEPASPYARHKSREDELLNELGARHGVDWVNLRLFNIFGRYEAPSRLLPYVVAQLSRGEAAVLSHGNQLRDFNDVDDIAEAFALALRAPRVACGAVHHIGSGRATTVREFALAIADAAGDPGLIRFGTGSTADELVPALVADTGRARRVLGWNTQKSLEERLRPAVDWWLARLPGSSSASTRHEELRR
jgi:nucleoside-diphosphate-sugar epimerase